MAMQCIWYTKVNIQSKHLSLVIYDLKWHQMHEGQDHESCSRVPGGVGWEPSQDLGDGGQPQDQFQPGILAFISRLVPR